MKPVSDGSCEAWLAYDSRKGQYLGSLGKRVGATDRKHTTHAEQWAFIPAPTGVLLLEVYTEYVCAINHYVTFHLFDYQVIS